MQFFLARWWIILISAWRTRGSRPARTVLILAEIAAVAIALLGGGAAHAVTYSLPGSIGVLGTPFASCAFFSGTTYQCVGSIDFGNDNDVIVNVTSNLTLEAGGSFVAKNNLTVNAATFVLSLSFGGSVEIKNKLVGAMDITAGGSVNLGNNTALTGNINAGGEIKLGNSTVVSGSCNKVPTGGGSCISPTVSIAGASRVEGNSGTSNLTFTVTRSATSNSATTVTYTTSTGAGTATGGACSTAGVDYATTTGTATVASGQTTTTVNIPLCGDTEYEGDESFMVTLSAPVNATLGTASATGKLLNDDAPPLVAAYQFDELVWNGTSGQVKDASGNGYHATSTLATTATGAPGPAYEVGSQSTCRYGVFGASGASYVRLPDSMPDLSGSFSISSWVYVNSGLNTNNQRIYARDDAENGWAMRLVGTAPNISMSFFNRGIPTGSLRFTVLEGGSTAANGVAIDTAFKLSVNTWYFIAVTVDTVGKTVVVYVYGKDGLQKSKLSATYTGTWTPGTGATGIGGETSGSNNPLPLSGRIDEVRVYRGAMTQTLVETLLRRVSACGGIDHVRIDHDGSGSLCQTETLKILACANADVESPAQCSAYTGGISGNVLVKNGATVLATLPFTVAAGDSLATVNTSFASTAGVTFEISSLSVTPTATSAYTCWNSLAASASCAMPVSSCASNFNCLDSSITPYSTGAARLYTKLAGTAFSFDAVALNAAAGQETNFVVSGGGNRQVTVELFDNTTPAASCSAYSSPLASQTLSFSSTDAGRKAIAGVTLTPAYRKLLCRVTDNSGASPVYGCSTDEFSVRPSAATLITTATAAAPSDTAAPVFKTGANFTLQATTSAGTGYGGSLSQDASKLTAQTPIQIASPQSGGAVGTLSPTALVANAAAVNASYSEVGYVYLAPGAYRDEAFTAVDSAAGDCITDTTSDNNLADALIGGKYGCHIGNKTAVSLGRFVPDHFDVSINANGAMAGACLAGGFTYTGQAMGYATAPALTIKPMSAASGGVVTQNYRGAFQKLTASGVSMTTPTEDATQLGADGINKTQISATMSAGTLANSTGTMTYTLNAADQFTYTRNTNAQVAANTNAIALIATAVAESEVSAVGSLQPLPQTLSPTGVSLRYGRARMANAYGSELLDLPIVFRAEYLSSSTPTKVWSLNSADSCSNATVSFAQVGASDITGNTCVLEPSNNSGMGCAVALTAAQTNRRYLETGVSGTDSAGVPGFAGNFNLWLKAPGSTHAGSINVTATVGSWLQYPWSSTTASNPVARATFGIYKSPLIYRRENY